MENNDHRTMTIKTKIGDVEMCQEDGTVDLDNVAELRCIRLCRRIEALEKRIAVLEKKE